MIEIAILIAVLFTGAMLAVLVLTRVGARHENRNGTLNLQPPTRTAATARRFTGLYVRGPEAHKHRDGDHPGTGW